MSIKRFAVLLVKNGLLGVALLLTAALSAVTTMRVVLTSQEVGVPSLVGRTVPDAKRVASRRGLLLKIEGKRNDPRVPLDHILIQEPSPGATLKSQRSIRVWLSLGPRRLTIPRLEGDSVRSARLSLDQAQIPVGRVVEVDDAAPEGTVLVQRPPAGPTDTLSEGLSLLVSRGTAGVDYLMPDLIGQRAGDVLEALRRQGLKVAEVRYRTYPGMAPGIILKQSPQAGHRVNPRTSLSLEISRVSP